MTTYGQPGATAPPLRAVRTSGLAIASLVLGITWVFWIGSILALVFGYMALGQIKRSEGGLTGRGMALAGVVLGWIGIATLALTVAIAVVASSDNSSNRSGSTSATAATPTASYTIGQTAKSGDFKFTVFAVTDPQPPTNQFLNPKPGMHFVSVDVEVINPSSANQLFSSLNGFHLLDSKNHQYDEDLTIGASLSPPAPDGQIPPNGSIRGLVGFQVPDGTTNLKFRAQGGITASGAIWKLY